MQRIRYQAARVELALNDRSGSNATGAAGLPTPKFPLFPVSDQDRAALQYVAMGRCCRKSLLGATNEIFQSC
jgi:hypothetical protein